MNLQETQEKMMELNKTMMETWKNVFGFKPEFLGGIDPIEEMKKAGHTDIPGWRHWFNPTDIFSKFE